MFTVRSPDSSEADVIAELVLLSDCGMLPALFGPRVGSLLGWLLSRRGNPYGAEHTLVVTEAPAGGATAPVIGAMVGAAAAATRAASLRTAGLLARWYGPAVIARLPRLARAGRAVEPLGADDFYLSHIAVLPAHRGRGAGAVLLRAAEDRARKDGCRRLVLDVEEHNGGARAFYARMGYGGGSALRVDLGRRGTFSFLRIWRGL